MSIFGKKEDITAIEEKPIDVELSKYKVVSMETKIDSFYLFENTISDLIKEGWIPLGGIDVKSISVAGWLLTQAMIKE